MNKQTYETVFNRDQGRCVMCKSTLALQLHHIDGRSRLKTDDVENCVMLCNVCHIRVHQNQKKYKPMLKEYIERGKGNEENIHA